MAKASRNSRAKPMSERPRWRSSEEIEAQYPHYFETYDRLTAVLAVAKAQGVSDAEITSILATMHARVIARLLPNEPQINYILGIFRQSIIDSMEDFR